MIAIEVHLDADTAATMARDVRTGLTMQPKELAPKYFYDERGSQLFEQITELPEYYPTRAERSILTARATEIVAAAGRPQTLVELGSGSAAKTRHLLSAMRDAGCLRTYVPVDISEEITHETAECLVEEYPGLVVRGLVCDFEHHLERIPDSVGGRLIAFLGGTIGNLYPAARREFLARLATLMAPGDQLLLGTDLVKQTERLEAAYDDAEGVTAEFNKNVLQVLNRELDADFDLDGFEHVARYDQDEARMDIRLRSLAEQRVRLDSLDLEVEFVAGEEMRTEISAKFTRERLCGVYEEAGMEMNGWFVDGAGDYALSLASPASAAKVAHTQSARASTS
ncbi:MAG TPA: L-histidine N(alpha)-methyltransferase [Solirubrobacterales bacterium]|nr:L-histidine N(alpha)-methyltransferase [Solirubrobacterales bacterium]